MSYFCLNITNFISRCLLKFSGVKNYKKPGSWKSSSNLESLGKLESSLGSRIQDPNNLDQKAWAQSQYFACKEPQLF